jgi:hypothetical protein
MNSPADDKVHDLENLEVESKPSEYGDSDDEFGGTEARKVLERRLLWKLDLRMSILVFM